MKKPGMERLISTKNFEKKTFCVNWKFLNQGEAFTALINKPLVKDL